MSFAAPAGKAAPAPAADSSKPFGVPRLPGRSLRSQYSGWRRKASFIGLVPPANIIVNSSNMTSSGLMVDRLGRLEDDRVLRSEASSSIASRRSTIQPCRK